MPQLQLPLFPHGSTQLSNEIAVDCRDNRVVYFNGQLPIFTHDKSDVATFRLFTSQLFIGGCVTQSQIVKTFGVPPITVKRSVAKLRQHGSKAFFVPPARRSGHKLTPERLLEAQALLDQGSSVPEVSRQLDVLASTLHKAIDHGRLRLALKKRKTPTRPVHPQSKRFPARRVKETSSIKPHRWE
jgi:transposase-like protein